MFSRAPGFFVAMWVLCACSPVELRLTSGETAATFSEGGAQLDVGGAPFHVVALARSSERQEFGRVAPRWANSGIEYVRAPGVTEWWREVPGGLEHGVTLAYRPGGAGALTVEIDPGTAVMQLESDRVALLDRDHHTLATYSGLVVMDADGLRLPSSMGVRDGRIALVVDDDDARYPIVIDPLMVTEEATLTPTGAGPGPTVGPAIAMSADGLRVISGSPFEQTNAPFSSMTGVARVFVRAGTSWSQETILATSDPDRWSDANFGAAVALSSDGTRALVGAPGDQVNCCTNDVGSVWVFSRTGSTWSREARMIVSSSDGLRLGASVAINADASIAVLGAPGEDVGSQNNAGTVRVYTRSATVWTARATLSASDAGTSDGFGSSVSISADGTRIAVGAPGWDPPSGPSDQGAVYVFGGAGASWTEEARIAGTTTTPVGSPVALDGTAARLVSGGGTVGAVFARTGTAWALESRLSASPASVAVNVDGSRVVLGVPGDPPGFNRGSARVFVRTGTTWTEEAALTAAAGATNHLLGSGVAIDANATRVAASAPGGARAHVFRVLSTNGSPCATGATCASNFCVDGVCCNTACGGGSSTDCQACSAAAGGTTNGTCTALSAAAAPGVTCRTSAGVCDSAEVCASTSMTCPADAFRAATFECRASASLCDAPELCTGAAAACPSNAARAAGTECRPSVGACDPAERCDGSSMLCPGDALAVMGAPCRPGAGACDVGETCSGSSPACPPDIFVGAGTECRVAAGACDVTEVCPGDGPSCPMDSFRDATTVCLRGAAGSECDPDDLCTGSSAACPPVFAAAATPCGAPVSGACDAPDHCSGTSGDCVPTFLDGVECRASTGSCDPAEACSGGGPSCPSDRVEPAGMVCGPSVDPRCDAPERCDGVAAACPADVNECMVDSGATDGGGVVDAGGTPTAAEGCACHAGGRHDDTHLAFVLLSIAAVMGRIRHRARRRRSA